MYFWNIEALKAQIRRGELTTKKAFAYLLIYIAYVAIGGELMSYLPEDTKNYNDYISSLCFVIVSVAGTVFAYKANGGAEGKIFADKYFSIGLVVTIRFLPLLVLIAGLLVLYWEFVVPEADAPPTTIIDVALLSAWSAAVYWRMCKHIRDTAYV